MINVPRQQAINDFSMLASNEAINVTTSNNKGRLGEIFPIVVLALTKPIWKITQFFFFAFPTLLLQTPLSILIAQTMGLKVANVPLVYELDPPRQLTQDGRIDPRRVFCLTVDSKLLQRIRATRLQRSVFASRRQKQRPGPVSIAGPPGQRNKYASTAYVQQDLAKARRLCSTHGYTEVDVTGRAAEETASLIVSKLKERFPDLHIEM